MKVLQLIDSLEFGGSERMAVNMANALSEFGVDSMLVATRKGGGLQKQLNDSVKVRVFKKKSFWDLSTFMRLIRFVKSERPEFIHAHSTSVFWAMILKMFMPSLKVIWHHHLGMSDIEKAKPRPLIVFLSRWFDGVVVVNSKLYEWAIQDLKCKRNAIVYLMNFSNIEPVLRTQDEFNGIANILHLANFRSQKDHMNLMEAIKILNDQSFAFRLILAGSHTDPDIHDEVISYIEKHRLSDKIQIPGPIDDISSVLQQSNIGVLSSVSEGYPVSLIEYGLGGLYIVSTNAGQCRDILQDGKFGVVVPIRNPEALAEGIKSFYNNKIKAFETAAGFQQQIINNQGKVAYMKRYIELLNQIAID